MPTPPSTSSILAQAVTETKDKYEFPVVFNDIAYWEDVSSEGNKLINSYKFMVDSTEMDEAGVADIMYRTACQKFYPGFNDNKDIIFVMHIIFNDKTTDYQVPASECVTN